MQDTVQEEKRFDHDTKLETTLLQKSELRVDTSFKMFMKVRTVSNSEENYLVNNLFRIEIYKILTST